MGSYKGFEQFRRPTKRDVFLKTMDRIVPWDDLCSVIGPHYPKGQGGRPPIGLERMVRMLFVQHWFSQKELIASKAPHAGDFTNERVRNGGEVDERKRSKNRSKSKVRARVEHVFQVLKRLWGFTKVRYRGLQKNATRAFTALALASIYMSRRALMG